jgi:hypothetical protein
MPVRSDITVVASAYNIGSNGGRKLVKLNNEWLVSVVHDYINTKYIFYISKDNGATWTQLCYTQNSSNFTGNNIAITSAGTKVYVLLQDYTSYHSRFIYFDAATVTNTNQQAFSTVDSNQTSVSGCSLAINEAQTELHACWSSKNATYPNSYNIRYAKGTINADGSVTWGSVVQVSSENSTGRQADRGVSICVNANNMPVIMVGYQFDSTKQIASYTTTNCTTFTGHNIYSLIDYPQANPCAIFVPQSINGLANGRIWVTWTGVDSSLTLQNVRVAYSDDGGITWSTQVRITNATLNYDIGYPSICVNKANELHILFHREVGEATAPYNIYQLKSVNNGVSWVQTQITNRTTGAGGAFPTTMSEIMQFTAPLFIYRDTGKVGFYGTWTTTTISVTEGDIGVKSDKTNVLTYTITTDGTMSTITEKVNGVTVNSRTATSGQSLIVGLTQAQWDAIKYGKYKDATGGLNTLTVDMGGITWTYTFDKRLATTDDIAAAMKAVGDTQATFLATVKAKLAATITSKGGTAQASDTFDTINNAIGNIPVKKKASGTFTTENGGGTTTISGLGFTPSVVVISLPSIPLFATYCTAAALTNLTGNGTNSKNTSFYVIAITSGSFSLYSAYSLYAGNWAAYE